MIEFLKPERKVNRVFIHCSASDRPEHDDISVIKLWHLQRGWSNVGYHYFITKDGILQSGRPLEKVPAAQKDNNMGTIAICLHGLEKDNFTRKQFDTLRALCREIDDAYEHKIHFHGHCEVEPRKTCPVFNYRAELNLDKNGYIIRDKGDSNVVSG